MIIPVDIFPLADNLCDKMKSNHSADTAPANQSGQHTPGPWEVWPDADSDQIAVGPVGGGVAVCDVVNTNGCGLSTEESRARGRNNARLIASAPALLECIESLQAQLKAALDALAKCKAAVENKSQMPSARMELVRDYATPILEAYVRKEVA